MAVDEQAREQAILDAAVDLLLRFGYNKLTMADVADAVHLHRGLVYRQFKSKDELVEAVVIRELDRYALAVRTHVAADPEGGSVGSIARAQLEALRKLPLASAIVGQDVEVLGKYLRKRIDLFQRSMQTTGTREYLDAMREIGVVRQDVDTHAMAFITDALTPAIRHTFLRSPQSEEEPSWEALLEALADMLDRTLTPSGGADLAAGKRVLLEGIDRVRARLATAAAIPSDPTQQNGRDAHD